jgi:hypothetical protein
MLRLRLTLHELLVVHLRWWPRLVVVMLRRRLLVVMLMLRWRWTAAVVVRVPAAAVSHAGRVPGPRIHRSEKRSNQGEIRPAGRSDPRSMTRQEESGVGCSNWGKKFWGCFRGVSLFWRIRG